MFPKEYPIFWGPNQRILEDDVYVEPSGFVHKRYLTPPRIVRFITDAHEVIAEPQDVCTFEKGHIYPVPGFPIFAVNFRRVIGTTFDGGAYWVDCNEAMSDPGANPPARGLTQYINALTGDLVIVQPDILAKYPDGHFEDKLFQQAFDANHTEISFYILWWRWFDTNNAPLGETFRTSTTILNTNPIPGQQLLSQVDTDPICPDDYFSGCPCQP